MPTPPTALDAVLSAFSHEVRTPLAAAAGALNLIAEEAEGQLDPDQRGFLAMARRAIGRVESLLVSIIESGRIAREGWPVDPIPTRIDLLVRGAVAEATDVPGRTPERVRVEVPDHLPLIAADPEGVRRIIRNLVTNALKHSGAAGPIVVRVRLDEATMVLEVIDRGSGVPPADRERIFGRFERGRTAAGGIGIGLFLARWIADAHGGALTCEAPPDGVGACFRLTLPLRDAPPRLPQSSSAVPVVRVYRADRARLRAHETFRVVEALRQLVPNARRWEGSDVVVAVLPRMDAIGRDALLDRLRSELGPAFQLGHHAQCAGRVA